MQNKWDKRFYELAETVATWSKDKTKVGCVLISPDKTKISYGYNGFPRGIKDDQRLTSKDKNQLITHAELNAILNSVTNLKDWTLYATKFPCVDCAKAIIQSCFKRIVVKSRTGGDWTQSQQLAYDIIKEANIIISEV